MSKNQKFGNPAQRELEAKAEAGLSRKLASGKKLSDMGQADYAEVADQIMPGLSSAARDHAFKEGLVHMARFVFGGIIAETIWQRGAGWPADDATALAAYRATTYNGKPFLLESDQEALNCLAIFREDLPDLTRDQMHALCSPVFIDRFRKLFIGQPEKALLGEIAIRKAASGNGFALSFLSWGGDDDRR